jgi:hypothetical protein
MCSNTACFVERYMKDRQLNPAVTSRNTLESGISLLQTPLRPGKRKIHCGAEFPERKLGGANSGETNAFQRMRQMCEHAKAAQQFASRGITLNAW